MRVLDLVTLVPQAATIMAEWGLHCSSCAVGGLETLAEGCRSHGWSPEDVELLLQDIEDARTSMPARPMMLTVTPAAAQGIRTVAREQEDGEGILERGGLIVSVDGFGGFCMDFQKSIPPEHFVFADASDPGVRVAASALTLGRIGGAVIDVRDGRFKLDLPEDVQCCSSDHCECRKDDEQSGSC